jgi:chromosome segregation ATPase
MSFFTGGNLLTLGIVVLGFILYHQLTRRNRTLDKIREYGKRLKDDLAAFVEKQGQEIHDFAVSLDVEKQSAKELLKRLIMTDQELADKAEAVARIDERLNGYDVSLEELVRMTDRVQENLNRLHGESGFVENAVKRVSASDERLRITEERLKTAEKDLEGIELRFERENADSLERTAEAVIASVRSAVSDLQAAAEIAERRVEDHREAIDKVEEQRAANISRDVEEINRVLGAALEEAAARADTLEDAAFIKLREQATDRAQRYQAAVEEKLRGWQESAKARVAEVQGLIKALKDEWKAGNAEMEAKQLAFRDEWKKDMADCDSLVHARRQELDGEIEAAVRGNRELLAGLEGRIGELSGRIDARTADLESFFAAAMEDTGKQARAAADGELEAWKRAAAEDLAAREAAAASDLEAWKTTAASDIEAWRQEAAGLENRVRARRDEWAAEAEAGARESRELLAGLEGRIGELSGRIDARTADLESLFAAAMEDAGKQARAAADGELEAWKRAAAEDLAARKAAAASDLETWKTTAASDLEAWRQDAAGLENHVRARRDEWEAEAEAGARESRELLAGLEGRIGELRNLVDNRTARVEAVFTETLEQAEIKARTGAAAELEAWKTASAAELDSLKAAFATEFEIRKTAGDREHERWKNTAEADYLRWQENLSEEETRTRRLLSELEASSEDLRSRVTGEIAALETKLRDFTGQSAELAARLEQGLLDATEDMEHRVLETTEKRLEEYREAQTQQYHRLAAMAEDAGKLDAELRGYMTDTENRVRNDFVLFERESAARRDEAAAVFGASAEALRNDLAGLERELAALKERAYENVSENLRLFEDDFSADLSRRKEEIDGRLAEWKQVLDQDLGILEEKAGEERQRLDLSLSEDMKHRAAEWQEELAGTFDRLKAETGVFEDEIRNQIGRSEETLAGYREQLERDLEEARGAAESSARAEIRQYALSTAETLKQAQRDLAASLRKIEEELEARNAGLSELQEGSRRETEEWQTRLAAQIRDADAILDDVRRRVRELAAESDERVASIRGAIEDVYAEADSRRTEVFAQTG